MDFPPLDTVNALPRASLASNPESVVQLGPLLLDFLVEVPADRLLGPGLVVEVRPALLLGVAHHVSHGLQVWGRKRRELDMLLVSNATV